MIIENLITRLKGNTSSLTRFSYKNKDGTPRGLSGVELLVQFKLNGVTGSIVKEISIGSGITVEDEAGGVFVFDKYLVDFAVGTIYYDIKAKEANADIKTYVGGTFKVKLTVTAKDI